MGGDGAGLSSLMGGNGAGMSPAGMEQVQARADQCDQNRTMLATLFKISEGKAEKLMEKKMEATQKEMQSEMLKGLQNLGS